MSNLKQFLNKNNTVELKAKNIYFSLLNDYNSGVIKTKTEFIYRLKKDLYDFYNSINKPTFQGYYAKGTPVADEYNTMIKTAIDDINNIATECLNLDEAISGTFNSTGLNEESLSNASKLILKTISDLEEGVYSYTNNNIVSHIESFADKESVSKNSGAYINTNEGILTLPIKMYSSCDSFNLEVRESNGLPGNTHVAENTKTGIVFEGESNTMADIKSILNTNRDEWFEYEMFNIDDKDYNNCNGMGFAYAEGIEWISDDSNLYMKLRIYPLVTTKEYNWFAIQPYIPSSKAYIPAVIERVVISDGAGEIQDIRMEKAFKDNIIINFKSQKVSYLDIYINQGNAYDVNIGHIYSLALNSSNDNYFDTYEDNVYNRADIYNPSITNIGVYYDPSTSYIKHSSTENETVNTAIAKKELFQLPEEEYQYYHDKELLNARRYMIGIKKIALSNYTFNDKGTYISESITFDKEIESITLYAEDSIPLNFSSGEYIKYYISFDDGTTWIKLYPKDRAYLGACTVKINSEDPVYERNKNDNNIYYIDRLLETKSVKIKISLSKPDGAKYGSPIVYNYRLDAKLEGEEL